MMELSARCNSCKKPYGRVEPNGMTAAMMLRAAMKKDGWLYKSQKDICPECAKKEK